MLKTGCELYKFFLDKVRFLDNGKIYDLASLSPKQIKQLEQPIPEIRAEEVVVDYPYLAGWRITHDSTGTHVTHYKYEPTPADISVKRNGRPRLDLPVNRIRELQKQGLGSKAIATQLKRDGCKISYKTVQRFLSREIINQSGQKVLIRA